mmetsp:Transcript_24149/g.33488  ORF Transcript_24149/g.33488 Transcript_24149/m.33488 type:complete len:136 (+) Transcript_24149:227-634(+)
MTTSQAKELQDILKSFDEDCSKRLKDDECKDGDGDNDDDDDPHRSNEASKPSKKATSGISPISTAVMVIGSFALISGLAASFYCYSKRRRLGDTTEHVQFSRISFDAKNENKVDDDAAEAEDYEGEDGLANFGSE